ncbi:MAG TPA: ABC transporter permease subunit [Rhodanobacteraceae bacterium]|nr:ABC transporter permease subunit [Rhodanobacteraceae bacterium]
MLARAFALRPTVVNRWDFIAVPLIFGALVLTVYGLRGMDVPLATVEQTAISLDRAELPLYALYTTLRMFAAMIASLVFTFTYGALAAKSRRAEMILVPVLDILQSVPILGFLSFTVVFFLSLFPGRAVGAECAAVFAIFTSQAWNMAFSFYQSLRTLPDDLQEVSSSFRLSGWQKFWRLEVPFAMPGLVWNMMMSMSGGWFFVVAAETISVGAHHAMLPGLGSYVATAIAARDLSGVGWALATMLIVIVLYDQLMFRPLAVWAEKFRFEQTAGYAAPESWSLRMLRTSRVIAVMRKPAGRFLRAFASARWLVPRRRGDAVAISPVALDWAWGTLLAIVCVVGAWLTIRFVSTELDVGEVVRVFGLGFLTLIRVVVLIALASLVWVPIGIWVGLRPTWTRWVQPIAQFLAAFPANLLFPIAVVAIVHFRLSPGIWLSPLMVLGTQWYILFNVIAGASAFPSDLRDAATNMRVTGWNWWRRVIVPGIFPYYVTGGITASGGSWNASIVSETVSWGDTHLTAAGLGSYIAAATDAGDYPRIVLGIAVMSVFVTVFNRLVWRPMYAYAERRLRIL